MNSCFIITYEWILILEQQMTHSAKVENNPLLSFKAQERKDFGKASKPCHVGIHWIVLAEYSQMSTHMPGFQSFFRFFDSCVVHFSRNFRIIPAGTR